MINGVLTDQLTVADRGFQYGDGVFETLLADNGKLQYWVEHMRRLAKGCQRLQIPVPDASLLQREVNQLLDSTLTRQVIKIVITRGSGQRGYQTPNPVRPTRVLMRTDAPHVPVNYLAEGVRLNVCQARLANNPVLAGIKHLNRLEQILARAEWNDPDITDGIMLNTSQHVIETTAANLFWVTQNQLFTPDLSQCGVEGIVRQQIIELAKVLQIPCTIGQFTIEEMMIADEIFITNCVRRIWPVRQIEQRTWSVGKHTRQFMSVLDAM